MRHLLLLRIAAVKSSSTRAQPGQIPVVLFEWLVDWLREVFAPHVCTVARSVVRMVHFHVSVGCDSGPCFP